MNLEPCDGPRTECLNFISSSGYLKAQFLENLQFVFSSMLIEMLEKK